MNNEAVVYLTLCVVLAVSVVALIGLLIWSDRNEGRAHRRAAAAEREVARWKTRAEQAEAQINAGPECIDAIDEIDAHFADTPVAVPNQVGTWDFNPNGYRWEAA